MELWFECLAELPKLAWCVEVHRNCRSARVMHGPGVETSPNAFCEGAWSGEFGSMDFVDDDFLSGSGAMVLDGKLVFACPNHSLDRICMLRQRDALLISNSIPFILAKTGDELDPRFLFYDSLIASVKDGLHRYVPVIPTRQKQSIRIYYHVNVAVASTLQTIVNGKKEAPRFANFAQYRDYLQMHVQRLFDNAGDSQRQIRFVPLSTISSGYDSSAAAVLARDAGCREAVTIDESRRTKESDSGASIAAILGLDVRTFGRLDYRNRKGFPEAEFSGGPSDLASMADAFAGRIVSTGYMGDCVWDLNFPDVTADIVRGSAGGSSLTEFRLRHGFVHLPVPFIGCTSHPAIQAISTSDEMKPWRIGGRYDRPIARRILEDAGVPRDMVGMRKRAVAVYVTEEGIDATLGPESLSDFNAFLKESWNWAAAAKCRIVRLTKALVALNEKARKASVLLSRRLIGRTLKLPRIIPRRIRVRTYGYIGRESLLFHWGVQKLVQRYRAALSARDPADNVCVRDLQAMQ